MWIEGRTAVVVGGAQGIGRACVGKLLEAGAKVCVADIDETAGKKTEVEFSAQYGSDNVMFVQCDVRHNVKEAFKAVVDRFEKLEIVYISAGIGDEVDWERCVDVNLCGSIRVTHAAMDIMSTEKGGSGGVIILTSSVYGVIAAPRLPIYAATKHAIVGFTRSCGAEMNWDVHGIRVNALCPGVTRTGIHSQAPRHLHVDQHGKQKTNNKMMEPEDVASVFLECCEDQTITGECIKIYRRDNRIITENFPRQTFS